MEWSMNLKLEGRVAPSDVSLTMVIGKVLWVAKERSWQKWQFSRSGCET